ncbi:Hypothetical protein, putative [Bodo saltans]|uniref:Uncharacterized protein n=1 Tax=Bodo saltans TaxID=75058 RepID=A0A0S4JUJ7_BODSA|nr:Hypothetical protein, putative [Bodo saltans]|eukprot:CUG93705.1 Hypothetical protein, putative [Bodo saltans]
MTFQGYAHSATSAEELLCVQEEISRSLLCSTWAQEDAQLAHCIADGLYFFANNERIRRTYFRIRDDVNSRAPAHIPKTGEWDYHMYFLTRKEYERKNPYRLVDTESGLSSSSQAPPPPPGLATSTIENPAQEYFVQYVEQQNVVALEAAQSISHNPILRAKQQLRATVVHERHMRQQIMALWDDFLELCRLRRDRSHRFALPHRLPIASSVNAE